MSAGARARGYVLTVQAQLPPTALFVLPTLMEPLRPPTPNPALYPALLLGISWMREPRLREVMWSVQFGAGWNQGLTSLELEFCLEKEKAQTKGVCWEGSALS